MRGARVLSSGMYIRNAHACNGWCGPYARLSHIEIVSQVKKSESEVYLEI